MLRLKSAFVRTIIAFATLAVCFSATAAFAAPVTWKVVSNTRNSSHFTVKWKYFADEMAKRTNGEVLVDVTSFPELNLTGNEMVRMLGTNLIDMAEVVVGYVSGDSPILEASLLAGMFDNYDHIREGFARFLPTVQKPEYERALGGIAVGTFAFSAQHIWGKFPVNSLEDFKGKKIRVFAVSQADYINALGGEAVYIPLADLYVSLERGLIDGCVTGPESGAGQKLWEVASHITDLRLGAGAGFIVVSRGSYEALSDKNREVFNQLCKEIDAMGWSIGVEDTKLGLDQAVANGMTLKDPGDPSWNEPLLEIVRTVVAPNWAERSGAGAKEMFNEVYAPLVGFELK